MDDINIEFVETTIDLTFTDPQDIDLVFIEPEDITLDFSEETIDLNFVEPEDIIISFEGSGGGGGAVDSVNGQIGVVELDAGDVGADPIGSAAQALTDANIYTDQELANLDFLESIIPGAGITVDNTDPQNPIVSADVLPQQIYLFQNQEYTSTFVYVGYEAVEGDWYIYRRNRATNVRQYAFGATDYATAWSTRASLVYT